MLTASDESHPRCPSCDYDLTGLSRPQCPECGMALSEFDMKLSPRWRRRGRWRPWVIVMAIPAAVLVGAVPIVALVDLSWRLPFFNGSWLFSLMVFVLCVLAIPIPFLGCVLTAGIAAQQVATRRAFRRPSDGLLDVRLMPLLGYTVLFTVFQWVLLTAIVYAVLRHIG